MFLDCRAGRTVTVGSTVGVVVTVGAVYGLARELFDRRVGLAAALVTALAMPLTPPGVPIMVAALVAAALGWRGPVLPAALRGSRG